MPSYKANFGNLGRVHDDRYLNLELYLLTFGINSYIINI
jgi:hypothetical protein